MAGEGGPDLVANIVPELDNVAPQQLVLARHLSESLVVALVLVNAFAQALVLQLQLVDALVTSFRRNDNSSRVELKCRACSSNLAAPWHATYSTMAGDATGAGWMGTVDDPGALGTTMYDPSMVGSCAPESAR